MDAARTTKNKGAGLGLAIAKEIVLAHKGTIAATSQGEDISFQICLPKL